MTAGSSSGSKNSFIPAAPFPERNRPRSSHLKGRRRHLARSRRCALDQFPAPSLLLFWLDFLGGDETPHHLQLPCPLEQQWCGRIPAPGFHIGHETWCASQHLGQSHLFHAQGEPALPQHFPCGLRVISPEQAWAFHGRNLST